MPNYSDEGALFVYVRGSRGPEARIWHLPLCGVDLDQEIPGTRQPLANDERRLSIDQLVARYPAPAQQESEG